MEDSSIRAITIGVGLFVVLLTVSAIIGYVIAARNMATVVDQGLRLDELTYDNILDYDDVTINAKGIDAINFIRKNITNENINIYVNSEILEKSIYVIEDKVATALLNTFLFRINANAIITMTKETLPDGKIEIKIEGTDIYIATQ